MYAYSLKDGWEWLAAGYYTFSVEFATGSDMTIDDVHMNHLWTVFIWVFAPVGLCDVLPRVWKDVRRLKKLHRVFTFLLKRLVKVDIFVIPISCINLKFNFEAEKLF